MGKGGKGRGAPPPPPQQLGAGSVPNAIDWRVRRDELEKSAKAKVHVNITGFPAGPLDTPRWDTTFAAAASDEGSDGVVFIATKAGAYVIKASSKPAEEYFATQVLGRLGVRVPDVRVVCHADSEWREIKRAVKAGASCQAMRGDAQGAARLRLRLDGPLNRAQLIIMSLIPNASPLEGNAQAASFFSSACGGDAAEKLGHDVLAELHMLGRCLAADVLLNNVDRCMAPCWDHEGNGGNIVLAKISKANRKNDDSGGTWPLQVVAIDSAGTCLATDSPNFQKYLQRACAFLNSVCNEASAVVALEQFRTFMHKNCGVLLNDSALREVRQGVLQVLADVAAKTDVVHKKSDAVEFVDWVDALRKKVRKDTIKVDWENVWAKSADLIDMSFLRKMIAMFQEVAREYQAVLPQPLPTTSVTEDVTNSPTADSASQSTGMSAELWGSLPITIQEELLCAQEKPFKILILQHRAQGNVSGARLVADALQSDKEQTGQMAGLVLLPENFVWEKLRTDITPLLADAQGNAPVGGFEAPVEIKSYAEVARKFGVYIVCGTMYEPVKEDPSHFYITSVVMGPDGRSVGAYRKRRIHNHEVQMKGNRPLVFCVPGLGKVALLICLDAEDACLRDEVLNLGARCVLNPIHIPCGDGTRTQWQVALDAMGESFSHVCHARGITWVRCDLPFPHGMGSSQAIGAEYTHAAASMDSQALSVLILPPPSSSGHIPLLMNVPDNSRERQRCEQNDGARCTVSSIMLDGKVTALRFYFPNDLKGVGAKKLLVTFADHSVAIIGVFPLVCVEKTGAVGTPSKNEIDAEVGAAEAAASEAALGVAGPLGVNGQWLDSDARFFLGINSMDQLEVCKRGSDGNLRRPLVIPTANRISLLGVDRRDGTFATVSVAGASSQVSFWSFAHNCIPAPLHAFLDL